MQRGIDWEKNDWGGGAETGYQCLQRENRLEEASTRGRTADQDRVAVDGLAHGLDVGAASLPPTTTRCARACETVRRCGNTPPESARHLGVDRDVDHANAKVAARLVKRRMGADRHNHVGLADKRERNEKQVKK